MTAASWSKLLRSSCCSQATRASGWNALMLARSGCYWQRGQKIGNTILHANVAQAHRWTQHASVTADEHLRPRDAADRDRFDHGECGGVSARQRTRRLDQPVPPAVRINLGRTATVCGCGLAVAACATNAPRSSISAVLRLVPPTSHASTRPNDLFSCKIVVIREDQDAFGKRYRGSQGAACRRLGSEESRAEIEPVGQQQNRNERRSSGEPGELHQNALRPRSRRVFRCCS